MSDLHVRQIMAALEKHFDGIIDLSDLSSRSEDEKDSSFLSRAQLAFVFSYLSGIEPANTASSITDGFEDNGIDGIMYSATERVLYIGQSKWRHDGKKSIDRGELQKFIKGFRDLINARWDRFNKRIQDRASEIETALNDSNTRIVIVVAYTGQEALSPEIARDLQDLLDEMNNPTELVTKQVFRQSNIYGAVAQGFQGAPINLEVALYEWGPIRNPYEGFYGQISAGDIASWFDCHQNRLFAPNIRMFLGTTDVNTNMVETLLNAPQDFWYFNNGISALCRTIKKKPIGGSTRESGIFECSDLRIVNGAQTVGAIAEASQKKTEAVSTARVPFRMISLETCPSGFAKKVTKYNNTQNRIDRRDFVALDIEQERIKGELLLEGITYVYKSGEKVNPLEDGFGLEEATVARACLQSDVNLAVQAKREIGRLWEDIAKQPYRTLFNPSVSGPSIWIAVRIVRTIEATLAKIKRSREGRNRLLAIHGNRFIAHLVFSCLSSEILQGVRGGPSVRLYVQRLTEKVYEKVFELVNEKFPEAYLANLFKNTAKCQMVKKLFSCPKVDRPLLRRRIRSS